MGASQSSTDVRSRIRSRVIQASYEDVLHEIENDSENSKRYIAAARVQMKNIGRAAAKRAIHETPHVTVSKHNRTIDRIVLATRHVRMWTNDLGVHATECDGAGLLRICLDGDVENWSDRDLELFAELYAMSTCGAVRVANGTPEWHIEPRRLAKLIDHIYRTELITGHSADEIIDSLARADSISADHESKGYESEDHEREDHEREDHNDEGRNDDSGQGDKDKRDSPDGVDSDISDETAGGESPGSTTAPLRKKHDTSTGVPRDPVPSILAVLNRNDDTDAIRDIEQAIVEDIDQLSEYNEVDDVSKLEFAPVRQ